MPPTHTGQQSNQLPIPLRDLGRLHEVVDLDHYRHEDGATVEHARSKQDTANGGKGRPRGQPSLVPAGGRDASQSEGDASGFGEVRLPASSSSKNAASSHAMDHTSKGPGPLLRLQSSDELETSTIASFDDDSLMAQESFSDTARLTNPINIQPMSGMSIADPPRGRRRTNHGIQFLTPNWNSHHRTDDEPSVIEAGLNGSVDLEPRRSASRDRSPSLAVGENTLLRAGTVMRKMSQRIVNLSNEPELVEKSMRKKSSEGPSSHDTVEPVPPLPAGKMDVSGSDRQTREEKQPEHEITIIADVTPEADRNPFRGYSLGIFSPNNRLRLLLSNLLVHPATEPVIFLLIILQTIFLSVDSASDVFEDPRSKVWGSSWIDYALLALFCIYTTELAARIIVSGFVINPIEYSTINRQAGFFHAVKDKYLDSFTSRQQSSMTKNAALRDMHQPSLLRSFTTQGQSPQRADHKQQQRERLAHRAFLRHSFNRLDFVAVVSFWISFVLAVFELETSKHIFVFRMLSCLRILRLLGLTSGTSIILRSLKKATPLLVNIAFLIGFFWLLFAVVGVQSFKSSLRRTCVWVDPLNVQANFTHNAIDNFQFCGGHINQAGNRLPWITANGENGTSDHKGYLCPVGSFCVEGDNPYNGTVTFDNVLQSLELVFVVISSNSFSDILYYMTDSDYLAAALCKFY